MNIISSDVEINNVLVNNQSDSFYRCLNNWHKKSVKIHKNKITLFQSKL